MKAFQLTQPRKFTPVEAPKPTLNNSAGKQVIVKTRWVSICASDIPFFKGSRADLHYPLEIGSHNHECVGEVVESSSPEFRPGDYVIAVPDEHLGLAEYYLAAESSCAMLTSETYEDPGCCLIQPLATVLYAVERLDLEGDPSVAILGLGSIGLLFAWVLKHSGISDITGIDPLAFRCNLALQLGIDSVVLSSSADLVRLIESDPSGWKERQICIEAVGHQMETVNDAVYLVRKRGQVLAFGVPDQDYYQINYEAFFRKNAHLIASVTPHWAEYLAKARDLYIQHRPELALFVTHQYPISNAQLAYEIYADHESGIIKAILDAHDW